MCLEAFLIVKDDNNNINNPVASDAERQNSRNILRELSIQENERYYRNNVPFECIICYNTIAIGDGILFRNCLHPFCKPCLLQMTQTSTEPTMKCPHDNCGSIIEERELRGVRFQSICNRFSKIKIYILGYGGFKRGSKSS